MPARTRDSGEERVTPLELFFDLIFVFAITQVTGLVVADPTWAGLVRGLLVLSVLWWAWAAYAWLTNTIDPEEGVVRLAMFGAMGGDADRVVRRARTPSATTPFSSPAPTRSSGSRTSSSTPLPDAAIGSCSRRSPGSERGSAVGSGCSSSPRRLDGKPQAAVWAIALASDLLGPYVGRARGWHLSPGHFVERHGLIVIIALGESIVALGAGATGRPRRRRDRRRAPRLRRRGRLWWAYFDVVAIVAERRLTELEGDAQLAMARDSYSYLHLPMVAGIILFAVGVKKTLGARGRPARASSPRWRSAAASRCTSSRTSSSGSGTCTR